MIVFIDRIDRDFWVQSCVINWKQREGFEMRELTSNILDRVY